MKYSLCYDGGWFYVHDTGMRFCASGVEEIFGDLDYNLSYDLVVKDNPQKKKGERVISLMRFFSDDWGVSPGKKTSKTFFNLYNTLSFMCVNHLNETFGGAVNKPYHLYIRLTPKNL